MNPNFLISASLFLPPLTPPPAFYFPPNKANFSSLSAENLPRQTRTLPAPLSQLIKTVNERVV